MKDLSKTDYDGRYYPKENKMVLDSTQKGKEADATMLHEFVHAIFSNTSLVHMNISEDAQEALAHEISEAIALNFKLTQRK